MSTVLSSPQRACDEEHNGSVCLDSFDWLGVWLCNDSYAVVVNTKQVRNDDLQHIRKRFKEKGYNTVIWKEKRICPNMLIKFILFLKKIRQ